MFPRYTVAVVALAMLMLLCGPSLVASRSLTQDRCAKCMIPVNAGGCKCDANCDCRGGSTQGVAAVTGGSSSPTSAGGMAALNAHNQHRAKHGAAPLIWDKELEQSAYNYAARCEFKHDNNRGGQGENLFVSGDLNEDRLMEAATNGWYDEVRVWNPSNPSFSAATGHFTQVVWKGTTHVGCAAYACRNGVRGFNHPRGSMVVCRYSPPGNVQGRFAANV